MIITNESELRELGLTATNVLPEEVEELRTKLEHELQNSTIPGIGLAAPQIGIAKKMAIIRISSPRQKYHIDLVNCRILKGFDLAVFDGEGCLSFPGESIRTHRYQEIYVIDNLIKPFTFIATGLPAVAIQHELEHLEGKTFKDK